jgi:hypothetical protein
MPPTDSKKELARLQARLYRLESAIAAHFNGYEPGILALRREADFIRDAGNDGRSYPYAGEENPALWEPIDELSISRRARNALMGNGIFMVCDLVVQTEAQLLGLRNCRETTIAEIVRALSARSLHLGMVDIPSHQDRFRKESLASLAQSRELDAVARQGQLAHRRRPFPRESGSNIPQSHGHQGRPEAKS